MTLVSLGVSDGVGHLRLERPGASNALDLGTARALLDGVTTATEDERVSAVLLTGAGPRFSVGGDLGAFMAAPDPSAYVHELATTLDRVGQLLRSMPKPVVVGVHGVVAGGSLALMLSADLIVAAQQTTFVTAYSKVGLTPDCGLSWLLPRSVGHHRAAEMLLMNRTIVAEEALAWGLVTHVVPDTHVAAPARQIAARLAAGPTHALGQTSRLLGQSWGATRQESGDDESRTITEAFDRPESVEAIEHFLGVRPQTAGAGARGPRRRDQG